MRALGHAGPALAILGAMALIGCSGASGIAGPATFECTPPCPGGFQCTESGCVPGGDGGGRVDLATSASDAGDECGATCGGSTPYCNPAKQCVPCLTDAHCPPGNVCRPIGVSSACVPGCTSDDRCGSTDGGTSARCCDNACVDTSTDATHCGGCGTVCSVDNARSACSGGACVLLGCVAGWGDCNLDAKDGCETNLHVDSNHCSACGAPCSIPHAASGCAYGCYIRACDFGWDDCNGDEKDGCETSTTSDPSNCGGCGLACSPLPHAKVGCVNAACAVTACLPGWSDCDGDARNGCEAQTASDLKNCGSCGDVCGQAQVCVNGSCTCANCNIPNAKTKCVQNMCVFDQCLPSWGDCDKNANNGCEVRLDTDASNCGACGMACPGNQICVAAACIDPPPALAVWHLDENAGANFADSSGHGHSGTTNGTTWTPGVAGSALSFPAAGDAQAQGNYTFSQSDAITVEGWIYLRRQTGSYQGIVSAKGCCNYRLMVSPKLHPYFNPGERRDRSVDGFTFTTGQWYHVAMTIDGGVANIYVNGDLVATEPRDGGVGLPDQNDVFLMGAGESAGLYVPDGIVDEAAIYDKALDQKTLQAHFNNPGKF